MSTKSIEELQKITANYFDSLNTSQRDIEFYLSDEKNSQLYDLAEMLEQIYLIRNKSINKFKKYSKSNQYYFDLYQEIKKLPKNILKNLQLDKNPSLRDIRLKNSKLLDKVGDSIGEEKILSSQGQQYKLLSDSRTDISKMKIKVNNYLMDLFIHNCVNIIDMCISILKTDTRESLDKRIYQKQQLIKLRGNFISNSKESKKDWQTRIQNLFFKNKVFKVGGPYANKKTPYPSKLIYSYLNEYTMQKGMVNVDFTSFFLKSFPIEGWLRFRNTSSYNYYGTGSDSYKPYTIDKLGEEKYFDGFPFFFDDSLGRWLTFLDAFPKLITKPLINKLILIHDEYNKDTKDLYTKIQSYCCVLKKNNSVNHSIRLCEKLIVDYKNFVSFEISGYQNRTSFFINQMKLASLQKYDVEHSGILDASNFFQQVQDHQARESFAYHPLNINIKNGFEDIYGYIFNSLNKTRYSTLFDRHSGINNSDNPLDRHGYLKTGFKDWNFRERARTRISKNHIRKIYDFIQVDKNTKDRQLTLDWILLELVNFNEENYKDYLDKDSRYEVFGTFNIKYATKALNLAKYKIERFNDFALEKLHKKFKKLKMKKNIIYWYEEYNIENKSLYQSFFKKNCPPNVLSQFVLELTGQKVKKDNFLSGIKKAEGLNALFKAIDSGNSWMISEEGFYISQPYHCRNIKILESIINKYEGSEKPNKKDYNIIQAWLKMESVFYRKNESYFLSNQNKGMDHEFFQFKDKLKNSRDNHKYKIVDIIIDILDLINVSPMCADNIQEQINNLLSEYEEEKIEAVKDKLLNLTIKESYEYEISIWLVVDLLISAQKNQISIRLINRINNNILQALLFIQGVFPFSDGAGLYDPYRKIASQLNESISFYKNVAITMYEENNPRFNVPKEYTAQDPAKLPASLITSEIINSLESLKDYINILEINNIYDLNTKPGNLLTRNDITKEHMAILVRSNDNNSIYANDLKLKKYLKNYNEKYYNDRHCSSCQKKINKSDLKCKNCGVKITKITKSKTAFIDKLLYSKKDKQLIQSKDDKNNVDRKSALKWLSQRSGKKKLNELCVSIDFSDNIGIETFITYSKENILTLKKK